MNLGETVIERIECLARISAYPWNLTRRIFTPEQGKAEALVLGWMQEAGLSVRRDPAGNLIGRTEGAIPGGAAIVIGGHIDTCEDAGRYDGTLGVLTGIAAIEWLIRRGTVRQHAVEVVAFVDDAAGRFGPRRLGSKAMVGRLDPHVLDWADAYNVTLRRAMEDHGLAPERLATAQRPADAILAYLEVAAEAGPELEIAGSPIGVVPGLSASSVLRVTLKGAAIGAATVPMANRRDALAGAAECILAAERIGISREPVRVTVGRLDVEPTPSFSVVGAVTFGVFVTALDDAGRLAAVTELTEALQEIAGRRRLEIEIERGIDLDATRCDPGLVRLFGRAVGASGHPILHLAQGMPTNASPMADLGPIGSLLVRCRGGVGMGPEGTVDPLDVGIALDALIFVVGTLASGTEAPSLGGSRLRPPP